MQKVNIPEKIALFSDHWHSRIVGELNNQHEVSVLLFEPDTTLNTGNTAGVLTHKVLQKI